MSGHSKWATIRRKKEKIDSARGKIFTRLIREINISSRLGGTSVESNARLRAAVDGAKAANMPAENIDRAIKKGAGELEGQQLEEITYEGYGPGGIAILVECVTDNRNRTVGEIRHCFSKRNGNMAESGSVAWMFERKGYLTLEHNQGSEDEIMEIALDAGATDIEGDGEIWEVYTKPEELYKVKGGIEAKGKKCSSAEIYFEATNLIKPTPDQAKSAVNLIEALEDLDDTQNVHSNLDMDEELMAALG